MNNAAKKDLKILFDAAVRKYASNFQISKIDNNFWT